MGSTLKEVTVGEALSPPARPLTSLQGVEGILANKSDGGFRAPKPVNVDIDELSGCEKRLDEVGISLFKTDPDLDGELV